MTLELPSEPDDFGKRWIGEGDGDGIVGTLTKDPTIVSSVRYDTEFPVLALAVENGSGESEAVDVPAARAHLKRLVEEANLKAGDKVAIRHWDPEPDGQMHRYALKVERGNKGGDTPPF